MRAPYNFVPLSGQVHFPDWAHQVSQDIPFSDGYCGTVGFKLQALTPLLVAADSSANQTKTFFCLPDGTPAIPGSALRGMVRAVLEIASFGKFSRVDDRAMSLRDLAGAMRQAYGDEMTTNRGKDRTDGTAKLGPFEPKSKSGWLSFREGKWLLQPCPHLRVDYDVLDQLSGLTWKTDGRGGTWRKTALDKYELWGRHGASLDVKYAPANRTPDGKPTKLDHPHSEGKLLRYMKVAALFPGEGAAQPGQKLFRGRLVFTGHPSPKKHMDFVFSPPRDGATNIELPDRLMRAFLQIHGETPEWTRRWQAQLNAGQWIPVFFLPGENGQPKALGLSQMFKLAYPHGIHDAIRTTGSDHFDEGRPDLAEVIFGTAPAGEAEGWRGRASFSMARLQGEARYLPIVETVLNGPKPSFFPNYVRQSPQAERAGKLQGNEQYATLMDERPPELRGWKRYPARPADRVAPPPRLQNQGDSVVSRLRPLAADARFSASLRVHNLRAVELGALLWAMTWGGRADCSHGLGMGKPFGYGQVRLDQLDLSGLIRNDGDPVASAEKLMTDFVAYMNTAVKQWAESAQLKELLAMAAPANAAHVDLAHYSPNPKDFAGAKKDRLVLKPYTALMRRS